MAERFNKFISGEARLTLSVSCVLSYGEKPILYGRLPIPYAYGNHEQIFYDDGVVGMYVS